MCTTFNKRKLCESCTSFDLRGTFPFFFLSFFFGITLQDPLELSAVLKYPLKLKKLSIYTLELLFALNLDSSIQIRAQNF
jgi:hypothetical protein